MESSPPSMAPRTIRWGILATGGIAETFSKDLLCDPSTRGVMDLKHAVVAAASSSSLPRAQQFLRSVSAGADARAYGSYAELVRDANVDIIYVATPHSHHFQNCMLALRAGKNVLCEKAFTVNADQTRLLIETARANNLFLMEAVWTRYFPISAYARSLVAAGVLGTVQRVVADNSVAFIPAAAPDSVDTSHRMLNPHLAGGALLDLGVYALTWVFQCLWTPLPAAARTPPRVVSALRPFPPTGADELTSILLEFPRDEAHGGTAHAIATTGCAISSAPAGDDHALAAGPSIRISGTKGELQIFPPAWHPTHSRLLLGDGTVEERHWPQPGPGAGSAWRDGFLGESPPEGEGEGHGMFWEADEAGRALIEGRKEGSAQDLDESLAIMTVMDEVRRQGGLKYPDEIESTEFPLELKGR